jgi:hypothetical protein
MRISLKVVLSCLLLAPLLLPLGGCGCGFDCSSDDDNQNPASLTLGLSDSLPEDLKQVVIEVDTITFRRSGADDVVVNTFKTQNQTDADTVQVDLLQYSGIAQLLVIENLALDVGTYNSVTMKILDGDINKSYVEEDTGARKEITVSGGVLTLPGIKLTSGTQKFTVEFSLAQSLQQQTNGKYLLATNGIRIENNATVATLSGVVDSNLFNTVTPCSEKTDPLMGNRVYLYQGTGLSKDNLADVFNPGNTNTLPANAIAPFAVASLILSNNTGIWQYSFGFVPAGDYTIAFACNTAADDAVNYNGLTIPLPANQVYPIQLTESQKATCNLSESASC